MGKTIVLLYHRIVDIEADYNMLSVKPENFEEHMKFLSKNFNVISLKDIKNSQLNDKNNVVITFDDGYYDLYENALPILKKYNIPVTMYITTKYIDTPYGIWTDNLHRAIFEGKKYNDKFHLETDWLDCVWSTASLSDRVDTYYALRRIMMKVPLNQRDMIEQKLLSWAALDVNANLNRRFLSKEEIKKLSVDKLIDFGAHTYSHCSLGSQSKREQTEEIEKSITMLHDWIRKPIETFSYPFGTNVDYNNDSLDILKECGIESAVVGYSGEYNDDTDMYKIPRYSIRNMDGKDFENYINNIMYNVVEDHFGDEKRKDRVSYVGKIEDDKDLINSSNKVLIWGTGSAAQNVYSGMCNLGIKERVVAFGDNNKEKCGKQFNGCEIVDKQKALAEYQGCICIVRGRYDTEICQDLISAGFHNLHIVLG